MLDAIHRQVERLLQERYKRLEEEGQLFLKMGYRVDELTIIQQAGQPDHVSPKSCLPIEGEP